MSRCVVSSQWGPSPSCEQLSFTTEIWNGEAAIFPSRLHIISHAFVRDHGSHETRGPEERSRQSNIDQKKVTALGVALRKFSGGTNLPEVETLKINCELNELSRCHDENCRVVEK